MTLQEQINSDLKDAMRAQNNVAKLALRAVKAALTEAAKSGSQAVDVLDDDQVQEVIQRQAKRRREAAAEFEKAGQSDRAAEEMAELAVLEAYLPQQLSEDEIIEIVKKVIAETGASSMKEMGQVMSAAMAQTAGRADGKAVNQIARSLLSA